MSECELEMKDLHILVFFSFASLEALFFLFVCCLFFLLCVSMLVVYGVIFGEIISPSNIHHFKIFCRIP